MMECVEVTAYECVLVFCALLQHRCSVRELVVSAGLSGTLAYLGKESVMDELEHAGGPGKVT